MKQLQGTVALITGGASGIGFGIAQALAKHNVSIALADVDGAALERAAASLRASGTKVLSLRLDVRDRAAWEAMLDRVEAELGPLQILCSNAGVAGSHLPIEETEWAGWQWTIDVNLHGTFHALRTCLPRMRKHGREGHLVCTSSMGAFLVGSGNAAYCAAKAGVIAMCEAVRHELAGTDIGISVLCPGLVATHLLDNANKLGPAGVPLGSHGPETAKALNAALGATHVGELVVTAIRENRFWIFTHPELRELVARRSDEILQAM